MIKKYRIDIFVHQLVPAEIVPYHFPNSILEHGRGGGDGLPDPAVFGCPRLGPHTFEMNWTEEEMVAFNKWTWTCGFMECTGYDEIE